MNPWRIDWTEARFAEAMRNHRAGLRWSQQDLAERLQEAGLGAFTQGTVSRLEKGERPLRLDEARVIADVLGSARQAAPQNPPASRSDQPATRDLLTLREVAEWTGTPVATLRYWRHLGTGPKSANLGRRVVYRRSDVQAWIDDQFSGGEA